MPAAAQRALSLAHTVKMRPVKRTFCEPYVPLTTSRDKPGKHANALGRFVLRDNEVAIASRLSVVSADY